MKYLYNILLTLDYLVNALTVGWYDEWVSTRAHRMQHTSIYWMRIRKSIDWVALTFFNQKQHCFWSYVSDQMARANPPENRLKYGTK